MQNKSEPLTPLKLKEIDRYSLKCLKNGGTNTPNLDNQRLEKGIKLYDLRIEELITKYYVAKAVEIIRELTEYSFAELYPLCIAAIKKQRQKGKEAENQQDKKQAELLL